MSADNPSPRASRADRSAAADNEGAETLKRAGEGAGAVGAECLTMCSDQFTAALESATRLSQFTSGIGKACFDNYSAAFADMTEIGREALTCRSPADLVNLQKKSIESASRALEAGGKLSLELFGALSQALQPLLARTLDTPERLFRAIADGDTSDSADLNLRDVA